MESEILGFDKRLLEKMAERGMSQADLCKSAGITSSMASFYCSGQRLPTLVVALRIAKALDTTVEYLIRGAQPEDDKKIATRDDVESGLNALINSLGVTKESLSPNKIKLIESILKNIAESDIE